MFRRLSPVLAILALALTACVGSERAAIATYFEESQSVAERMSEVGAKFETLMNVQENPLVWTDAEKGEIDGLIATLNDVKDEADSMSVPEAFKDAHPLLVESIGKMVGAIDIIRGIAEKPDSATMEKADEMTAMAENGEKLANDYVEEIEKILNEKYPEMMEEGDGQ